MLGVPASRRADGLAAGDEDFAPEAAARKEGDAASRVSRGGSRGSRGGSRGGRRGAGFARATFRRSRSRPIMEAGRKKLAAQQEL